MNESSKNKGIVSSILILYSRFLPAFYVLESALKLKLFKLIREELGEDWFEVQLQKKGNDRLFEIEINFIKSRKPSNYEISPERLVQESGLGLWVEFFNNRIYKLAKGRPIKIFHNRPVEIKRADIYRRLEIVKDFRNSIVHPRLSFMQDPSKIKRKDIDDILQHYRTLFELLEWLGESAIFSLEDVEKEVNTIKALLAD